jgi:tetratricopeptide (TPR) repeat protein
MYSETRAKLEQFSDPLEFERMCADILHGMGYQEVVPIAPRGGSDSGQDIIFTTESGGSGLACVTLRSDIERKFFEDMRKQSPGTFEKYIYFCTAYLTATQKVKLTKYVVDTLGAVLLLQDIEALRSLLDSTLTSIREQYLGIKDEKKEIFMSMLVNTQENLRKEYQAQLLLEKAYETSDFSQAEAFVQKAVELSPTCRWDGYRQLGIRSARIVIYGLPLQYGREYGQTFHIFTKEALAPYVHRAITYLEEAEGHAEDPDAEGLMYLACMYGYQRQYQEVISTLDKALTANERIREEFLLPRMLEILLVPCGSDRERIEQIKSRLHIPLLTKEVFCGFIRDIDLEQYHEYIEWIAVKRANMPGEKGVHILKICPPYAQNNGLVSADALAYVTGTIESVTVDPRFVTIEELYEMLCQSFFLVSPIRK